MVRCTWGRTADQAAEQTAHPTSGPRRRPGLTSDRCTQTDEEPVFRWYPNTTPDTTMHATRT